MQTMELKDKDVVVLGLGRSGMAAASLLQRDGAHVVVRDEGEGDNFAGAGDRLRRTRRAGRIGQPVRHLRAF